MVVNERPEILDHSHAFPLNPVSGAKRAHLEAEEQSFAYPKTSLAQCRDRHVVNVDGASLGSCSVPTPPFNTKVPTEISESLLNPKPMYAHPSSLGPNTKRLMQARGATSL